MFILGLVAKVHESELTSFVYETHIGYLGTLPALIGPNQDLKNYVPVNWEYICSLSYGDTLSSLWGSSRRLIARYGSALGTCKD